MLYVLLWVNELPMFALIATDTTEAQPLGSKPSKDPTTIGAGAVQQTLMGVRHVDPFDDRVSYIASDYTPDVPQAVSIGLGNNLDSSGYQATHTTFLAAAPEQNPNPTHSGNTPPRTQVDAAEQNVGNGGSFSETDWRPQAGLPVPGTNDQEYASASGTTGPQPLADMAYLQTPGVQRVSERAMGMANEGPGDRFSRTPSTVLSLRPWDTAMGSWPWTGDKSAQRPPIASTPFNDGDSIGNALPSPTGAGGYVGMTNELEVKPLTFRTAPSPWDTGNDGTYVDSGV